MTNTYPASQARRPGEPAPRRKRDDVRGRIGKNKLDINRSSKGFRALMSDMSNELDVYKFVDCDPTNRKTKRRNGRAKLKKFGNRQRTWYEIIVNEV